MKNKGFTLIELLAVITVIAIIATITVIVTNKIIKNTKNTLLERQKQTIEEAARDYYLKEGMNDNFDSKESCVNLSKLLSKGYLETKEVVNPKTKETMGGSVIITYSANQYNYKYQDTVCPYLDGQVVYFDVTKGETCNNYKEENSNTGVKSGCMKFYAFNDDGGDTINLLLDHNTTSSVAWTSSSIYENKNGPIDILTQLKTDTDSWLGTETPTNYTMDQTGQTSNAKYTIDYSGYKARLITANEIATITGNTTWDEVTATKYYYFDSKTTEAKDTCTLGNITSCQYGWLYDNTVYTSLGDEDYPFYSCEEYGCTNVTKDNKSSMDLFTTGYWTSSSYADFSSFAWIIHYDGSLVSGDVSINPLPGKGLRPVIEVLKSKLD